MATITIDRRRNVVGRFERRGHTPSGGMTLHTLCRRPSKDTLRVTSFTGHLGMAPTQEESCRGVIDFDIRAISPLSLIFTQHGQT